MGHAPLHRDVETRHLREAHRVVRLRPDRLRQVGAHLAGVDVEGGGELDVPDVVAAEARPHQAGDEAVVGHALVIVNSLHQGGCTVADADHRDPNRSHGRLLKSPPSAATQSFH